MPPLLPPENTQLKLTYASVLPFNTQHSLLVILNSVLLNSLMPSVYSAPHLHAFMRDILSASGVTAHIAEEVAEVLVGANLVGHDSHGLLRIPMYMKTMADGRHQPAGLGNPHRR